MSSLRNEAELEIDEDLQQQRKVWLIERISWVIMALLLLAAMLGLLGHGPLSSSTLDNTASGMLIQYERFERVNAQTLFRIQLKPQVSQGAAARLSFGQEFLRKVEVLRIEPEPAEVEAWTDHVTYVITRPDPGKEAAISIHYKPLVFGRVEVDVGLDGYPVQTFSQFIYP
jgi:hypothetical protein